jgi:transposase
MPAKLSETVVKQRLQELRNLKRLHQAARLREAAKDVRIAELEVIVASQQAQIDTFKIQIAELQTMVFGKRRQPPTGTPGSGKDLPLAPKPPRTKDSYRRPLPSANVITDTEHCPVSFCACGGELTNRTTQDRFVEDIPLPDLTPGYQPKLVTRLVVERGVCGRCGKPSSGRDLGGAVTSLGPNIRLLVSHLVSVSGMSYSQVTTLCRTLYGLTLSDGEIAGIMKTQHQAWLPAYNQLQADIRASRVTHVDETPWPIQSEEGRGYTWSLSDAYSPRVCFVCAISRGAVHAQKLFAGFAGVRVSDDYTAYHPETLPGSQQLCWAHLYRCIRDLRYNDNLPEGQLPYVESWYGVFAAIYQDLRMYLSEPYDEVVRETQAEELWDRVQRLVVTGPPGWFVEPKKLANLKAQLIRAGKDRLFLCLPADTPCDNNRAERDLRQLVLKRKRSFGSKTPRGAKALSTVLSLCTTTWRMNQDNYFQALAQL